MSCPPTSKPWNTSTSRLARAAYRAAVYPAGPEPTITTSYVSDISNAPLIQNSSQKYSNTSHKADGIATTRRAAVRLPGSQPTPLEPVARPLQGMYYSGQPSAGREEHGRARETGPQRARGRALPRRVRPAARRWRGCLAGGLAGGAQRERQAQLEADQRRPRPDEPGPLPGVG